MLLLPVVGSTVVPTDSTDLEYLVFYKGFGAEDCTWQTAAELERTNSGRKWLGRYHESLKDVTYHEKIDQLVAKKEARGHAINHVSSNSSLETGGRLYTVSRPDRSVDATTDPTISGCWSRDCSRPELICYNLLLTATGQLAPQF